MSPLATADEDEAFVLVGHQASSACIPKHVFSPVPCHLRALASELTAAFKNERAGGALLDYRQDPVSFRRLNRRVNDLLKVYSLAGAGDWRKYAAWNEHSYLRHLLWATEEFEIMLLCWKAGQMSRVHTHANSHCWFAVLDGQVRETQYPPISTIRGEVGALEPSRAAIATGHTAVVDLTPTAVADKTVGDVAYINDNIASHSVGCCWARRGARATGGGAMEAARGAGEGGDVGEGDSSTLHACTLHIYCPPIRRAKALEGGKVTECIPGFFSRYAILAA